MEAAKKERRAEQASQQELQRGMYLGGCIFVTCIHAHPKSCAYLPQNGQRVFLTTMLCVHAGACDCGLVQY